MKFFMIGAMQLRNNSESFRRVEIGEVIEFDGVPNSGMVPIDLEAHAAKQSAKKRPGYSDLGERRLRQALPSNVAAQLKMHEDALAAQLGARRAG